VVILIFFVLEIHTCKEILNSQGDTYTFSKEYAGIECFEHHTSQHRQKDKLPDTPPPQDAF
jgi:hypothetical protein